MPERQRSPAADILTDLSSFLKMKKPPDVFAHVRRLFVIRGGSYQSLSQSEPESESELLQLSLLLQL